MMLELEYKSFTYNNISLTAYIDKKQFFFFKAIEVARVLGYQNCGKAIQIHVSPENKTVVLLNCSLPQNGVTNKCASRAKLYNLINEVGFYQLVFNSKLETAQIFRQWVFKTVLSSIRKYGLYKLFDNPHNKMLQICNETRFIFKVIRRFYPHALLLPGLGELQDTSSKRIDAYRKGYQRGQADIIIGNKHFSYQGFASELKNPNNRYQISDSQLKVEKIYKLNGYKYLCSNDYDFIIKEIHDYMTGIRLPCNHCNKNFKHLDSLNNHHKYFHKITG